MNVGFTALMALVAVLAAVAAIAAGVNSSVALPAGAAAVGATAVLLVGVVERTRWPAPRRVSAAPADPAYVRSALTSGPSGRVELVLLLDRLERTEGGGYLPTRSVEEIAHLQSLAPEEFRAYLWKRVRDLEGRA